ncbi:MAG: AAA family ATPase [Candidatus Obscuribacter sp.]|nr:AAA family ATPase [Candidatus Obscuribacter sp.]MBK9278648.1 AAA family ATPase [Candidatus Obscuribacter sp.]
MLFMLEIENFYSIRNPQIIDLRVGRSVSDNPGRLAEIGPGMSERAPKVVSIFGQNASGKSNVLKALSFLSWFVRDSFSISPDSSLPFSRFLDEKMQNEPTRLAVWFTGPSDPRNMATPEPNPRNSSIYRYEVVLGGASGKPEKVLSETLKYWPLETNKQVKLFYRDESGKVKGHRKFGMSGYNLPLEKILRDNASVVSTLVQLKHESSFYLWNLAGLVVSNILIYKADFDDLSVAQMYKANPALLDALNREIERIDLGIRKLDVVVTASGPIFTVDHSGLDQPLLFPFESHGTRQFVKIFPLIFRALETGGVALIDELDLSIHPLVVPEILRWYYDPKRNPYHAQLWITSQGASLLEDLTKEEIFFCEKDSHGRTMTYRLSDINAVRRTDNFYRKYLGGVYGAVPKIG